MDRSTPGLFPLGGEIFVSVSVFRGRTYINIRRYKTFENATRLYPTKEGVVISNDMWGELLQGIGQVLKSRTCYVGLDFTVTSDRDTVVLSRCSCRLTLSAVQVENLLKVQSDVTARINQLSSNTERLKHALFLSRAHFTPPVDHSVAAKEVMAELLQLEYSRCFPYGLEPGGPDAGTAFSGTVIDFKNMADAFMERAHRDQIWVSDEVINALDFDELFGQICQ